MATQLVDAQRKELVAMSTTLTLKANSSEKMMDFIMGVVTKVFELTPEDIKGKSREKEVAYARHAYCYLCVKLDAMCTLKRVGNSIGRDHSTIINSIKKCEHLRTSDMAYAHAFNKCLHHITEAKDIFIKRLNRERVTMMMKDHERSKVQRAVRAVELMQEFIEAMNNYDITTESAARETTDRLNDIRLRAIDSGI